MPSTTRQALLQALSAAGGAYISGQQLAGQLGVSRAAVHKAAAALTAQGYALEAVSRRGYRLLGGDPFCAEAVGPYPAPVQVYDTLESSNRTAKLLALDGAPHGTLVLTAHQSAGRGRLGRVFESPAGKGVYLSVLLRPAVPAASAQTATIGAAVAVCRAVQELCGLELGIKWVNDLYYQGRKVCGILTEAGTDIESGQLEWLVVGIGLNLTTSPADWPEELARTAGSLYPGGPAPVGRAALAGAIARELLGLCPDFPCLDEYRALCDAFYSRARRDGAGASRFEDVVKEMSGDAARPTPPKPCSSMAAASSSSSARTAAPLPCATARSASAPPARPEPGLKAGDSSTKNFFQKSA